MFRQISLLTMMMPAMTFTDAIELFHGKGTAYTLSQVSAGNCNFMYDPGVGENYAALNSDQWDSTLNCGRCAEVSCDDSRCTTTSTSIVHIVDRCPECVKGDLDLSPTVFTKITGSTPDRYGIKWNFVPCPVRGNINYCAKNGSSSSWLAVQPTNFASGVASMKIANQKVTMVDSCYYFLLNSGSNVNISAVDIEITSVAGETITETLSLTSNNCTVGTANFKTSTTQKSTSQTPPTFLPPPAPAPGSVLTMPTDTAPMGYIATPTSSTSSYKFAGGSPTESSTQEHQEEQEEQSEVTNSFVSPKTSSNSNCGNTYESGAVIAADELGSEVKILQSSETGVEKMSSVQQEGDSEREPEEVTTKTESSSSKASTVVVAIIVLAVVGGIALATVVYVVKKRKVDDKRIDRDMAMMRSFDTFSSPVRFDETIAKI